MADTNAAKLKALEFLKGVGYDADSDAEAIDETFLAAMKSFTGGILDVMALSVIAKAFSVNAAIDDTLYHPEISKAATLDANPEFADELLSFYKTEVGVAV